MNYFLIVPLFVALNVKAVESYTPEGLNESTVIKDSVIRIKGTVTGLEDNSQKHLFKKLRFDLIHEPSRFEVLVHYYYEYKGNRFADINIQNGDYLELEGEFRPSSRKSTSKFQGILSVNDHADKEGFVPKKFIRLEKPALVMKATSTVADTSSIYDKAKPIIEYVHSSFSEIIQDKNKFNKKGVTVEGVIESIRTYQLKYFTNVNFKLRSEKHSVTVEYYLSEKGQTYKNEFSCKEGEKVKVKGLFSASGGTSRYLGSVLIKENQLLTCEASQLPETKGISRSEFVKTSQSKISFYEANLKKMDELEKTGDLIMQKYGDTEKGKWLIRMQEADFQLSSYYYEWAALRLDSKILNLSSLKGPDQKKSYYSLTFGQLGNESKCTYYRKGFLKTTDFKAIEKYASTRPCVLSLNEFTLYAIAKFPDSEKLDVWSIDQTGVLKHLQTAHDEIP